MNINSEVIENLTNIVGEKSILLDEPIRRRRRYIFETRFDSRDGKPYRDLKENGGALFNNRQRF